jgi:hypothetical protein
MCHPGEISVELAEMQALASATVYAKRQQTEVLAAKLASEAVLEQPTPAASRVQASQGWALRPLTKQQTVWTMTGSMAWLCA